MNSRYFIKLSYKGTNYHGWQIQPNSVTIQETLNKAFTTILRENIDITGAGRTDTGVHALNYIAHFDSKNENLELDSKFLFKINGLLPHDIVIHNIKKVDQKSHARFDAISRTYSYYIHRTKDPFLIDTSYFHPQELNIDKMNKACEFLMDYTDFTSFSKLHTDVKTNNCKITEAYWITENHKLIFTITADRFLRNMVRAIVGTLLIIGKNKLSNSEFINIIESKNRSEAGASAPAHGLFLSKILYPENIYKEL